MDLLMGIMRRLMIVSEIFEIENQSIAIEYWGFHPRMEIVAHEISDLFLIEEIQQTNYTTMDNLSKIGIWISRIVILGVSALFTWIAYRYLFNPVGNIGETEVLLQTPTAITAARINFGAFPLVVAV